MEAIKDLLFDYENLEEITLSGNSFGREACDFLALEFQKAKIVTIINFNDIFVGRKL